MVHFQSRFSGFCDFPLCMCVCLHKCSLSLFPSPPFSICFFYPFAYISKYIFSFPKVDNHQVAAVHKQFSISCSHPVLLVSFLEFLWELLPQMFDSRIQDYASISLRDLVINLADFGSAREASWLRSVSAI